MARGDYAELLEVSLLFLGINEINGKEIVLKPPGPYSNARWMSRIIIIFKIVLLRKQFKIDEQYKLLYPGKQPIALPKKKKGQTVPPQPKKQVYSISISLEKIIFSDTSDHLLV